MDLKEGASAASFTLTPVDNDVVNEDRTIVFRLSSAASGIGRARSGLETTVTIINDDVPEVGMNASVASLENFGAVFENETSESKSYTLTSANLNADVSVEASNNFQVSLDNTSFSSSVTIPVATANAGPVTIHARFAPTTGTDQALTGSITHSSAGIDNVVVTVSGTESSPASVINTSTNTLEDFGSVDNGAASASKSYTLSGSGLTADVSVTATDNFVISLDDVTFSASLAVPFASVNEGDITIFTQFKPTTGTNQALAGTITHTSTNAIDVVIAVSGTETGGVDPVDPILVDDFDYGTVAGDLTALSDWENYSGSIEPIQYAPDGLDFTGYAGTGGGSIKLVNGSGSREDIKKVITSQTSGTVYMAQLVNIASASSDKADFFTAMREGTSFFNRLFIQDDGAGNLLLGVARTRSDGGLEVFSTTNYSYNTTYLTVIKYDFTTKEASLFVISGAIPATEPTPDAVANTGTEPASLDDVVYRQAADNKTLAATADGLRIANSWKVVLGL